VTSSSTGTPEICAVSEYYYPNFSGAAIQAHRILSRLTAHGFAVRVVTTADQAAAGLGGASSALDGLQVHYLGVLQQRGWSGLRRAPRLRRLAKRVNQILRDLTFHIQLLRFVLTRTHRGEVLLWYVVGDFALPVFRIARALGRYNVIQISLLGADDPASFEAGGFGTAFQLGCFRQADRIIGLSRALTDSCLQAGLPEERVVRIPNGVDLSRFPVRPADKTTLCHAVGLEPARRYVAFVGSALLRKGIDVAVRAFVGSAAKLPDVDLLIVGPSDFSDETRPGRERQELVSQLQHEVAERGLRARVHWLGMRENVADYLRVADLFFFPTRREGLPNAMAEAMGCGLPVLASRLDGITTDLVEDGVEGRLVGGFAPADYARLLEELLGDRASLATMGQAARRRIEEEFELSVIVDRYRRLCEELGGERAQTRPDPPDQGV